MKKFRAALLLSLTSVLTVLVFFGAQLRVATVSARPSYTSSSTSSPSSNTCSGCHSGSAAAGGSVTVTGFASGMTYAPGVTQHLTVTLTDPTHSIYSYILTARLASSVSGQAGTYTAGTGSTVAGMDIEASSFSSSTWAFDWTPPSTSSGNVSFYLTGLAAGSPGGSTSGNGIYQSQVTLTPAAAAAKPDFSLSASNSTVIAGATGTSTVTVTPQNGFSGSIALSASGLPSGVTLSPTSIAGTSTLTLTASSTATTGTFPVTLTGTSGALSHTAAFSLIVNAATVQKPDFSISASPSSVTITPGSSITSTISITPINGFSSSVGLSVPGLPSGVSASFNPSTTTGKGTLTLTASSTAASMTVGLTVTGTSGTLTHTTTVTLTVNAATSSSSNSLSASPSSLIFNYQGGSSMPVSQKLTLGTKGGSLSYSASSSGGPWLTASPTGGTAPGTMMVSANPVNMSAGSYSGMIQLSASGGNSSTVHVTLNIASVGSTCDNECGGNRRSMQAAPFVHDPSSSGTLTAQWVDLLGMPKGSGSSTGDPGLVLSKDATAPTGTQTGATINNVEGPLTELGFDYREGGQCTATSPRFVVVTTDSVTHIVGGCGKGTITAAPVIGWKRVRFNLSESAQTSPIILPGDSVSSITLVMDQGPETGTTAAGGLVVIDNIDVNGTFVGKGSWTSASTTRIRRRD